MWRLVQKLGLWSGGGMAPQRLDREALRRRLADEAPAWVVDELADAFEPAFLTFRRRVEDRKRQARAPAAPEAAGRRPRPGRLSDASDEGDET